MNLFYQEILVAIEVLLAEQLLNSPTKYLSQKEHNIRFSRHTAQHTSHQLVIKDLALRAKPPTTIHCHYSFNFTPTQPARGALTPTNRVLSIPSKTSSASPYSPKLL